MNDPSSRIWVPADCYVAVTGIPEPQKMHAVIMVKFSRDVMAIMTQITHELADRLGPDTTELGRCCEIVIAVQ